MNAPAAITKQQIATAKGPAWSRYLPAVEAFMPGRSEDEKRHRAGLMLLRDMAASTAKRSTWEAAQILQAISTVAGSHAFTEMPVDMLDPARLALVKAFTAARDLDLVFEQPSDG